MSKGICVHSEIGALKKVVVHRPGKDLVNLKAEDFERVWIHDCFYLEYAQKEHDAFTDILRSQGAEVLYMEKLVAEAWMPTRLLGLRLLMLSLRRAILRIRRLPKRCVSAWMR